MGSNDAGSRKTSDVAATTPTAVRKASDAAGAAASEPVPEPKQENLSVLA